VLAESVEDRLDKIEKRLDLTYRMIQKLKQIEQVNNDLLDKRLDKIENFLKSGTINSKDEVSNARFDSIVGQWIDAEDSKGVFLWVNFDGQVCLKEKEGDGCEDLDLKALGENKFVFIGQEEDNYLEVDGDLLFVKSTDGKKIFLTMKRKK
tara:strand:+ start:296 stop:748 length:453 start_codon:yes stop_codon:yes gene_type:complete